MCTTDALQELFAIREKIPDFPTKSKGAMCLCVACLCVGCLCVGCFLHFSQGFNHDANALVLGSSGYDMTTMMNYFNDSLPYRSSANKRDDGDPRVTRLNVPIGKVCICVLKSEPSAEASSELRSERGKFLRFKRVFL